MTKFTYTATAPNGEIFTRTTHRVYTHAVLVNSDGTWGVWCYAGRADLAAKAVAQARRVNRRQPDLAVEVVELEQRPDHEEQLSK